MCDAHDSPQSEADNAEVRKRDARWLIAHFIPLDEWLGLEPRTDGDVDMYFHVQRTLDSWATTGDDPPPSGEHGGPMGVSSACWNDETSYFRFDEPTKSAPSRIKEQ